jgi:hypothetical protein
MYVIGYFYYLRYKGIITYTYRITLSAFDNKLGRRHDPYEIDKLTYDRKVYKVFVYTFYIIFPLLISVMVWNDHLGNI